MVSSNSMISSRKSSHVHLCNPMSNMPQYADIKCSCILPFPPREKTKPQKNKKHKVKKDKYKSTKVKKDKYKSINVKNQTKTQKDERQNVNTCQHVNVNMSTSTYNNVKILKCKKKT